MTKRSPVPAEVAPLIDALLTGVRNALGDNLVGVYLRGSLALGDFIPETSDVDLPVVIDHVLSPVECEALAALHTRIPAWHENEYGFAYEVSYIDRASIRKFRPGQRLHARCTDENPFEWYEHRDNFIIERWTVRERGATLYGPDPKTLIDPISPHDLRSAAAAELRIRTKDWASEHANDPPNWMKARYYQAFELETVCRALYTIRFGELPTKPQAVRWALTALPERWRPLIEWSQRNRALKTRDTTIIPELMRFVRWAVSRSG